MEIQGNQGVAFDSRVGMKFSYLRPVKKEFPGGLWLVVLDVAMGILIDVGVIKPGLIVFNPGKGIADLAPACTQSLDLRAMQDYASLECLQDVVIPPRFGIGEDFRHFGLAALRTTP